MKKLLYYIKDEMQQQVLQYLLKYVLTPHCILHNLNKKE